MSFKPGDRVIFSKEGERALRRGKYIINISPCEWERTFAAPAIVTFVRPLSGTITDATLLPTTKHKCSIRVENNPGLFTNGPWIFVTEYLKLAEPTKLYTSNRLGDFPKTKKPRG